MLFEKFLNTKSINLDFGSAPICLSTTTLSLRIIKVGIERILIVLRVVLLLTDILDATEASYHMIVLVVLDFIA